MSESNPANQPLKRRKILIFISIVFFAVLAGLSTFYIAQKYINDRQETLPGDTQDNSVFGNLNTDYQEELLEDMRMFFVGGDADYWKDWNYQNKIIFAHIDEIDKANGDIVVTITPPVRERFSNKRWNLHVSCPKRNTIAVSDEDSLNNVIDYGFNLLDRAKVKDILIGYCLEEDCLNIGKKCYLIVR